MRILAEGDIERRFGAVLAVLGACVAPLIHFSVYKWRGQHPTVLTARGGGLDPAMWPAFAVALLAFTLLCAALITRRTGLELLRRELEHVREEAALTGEHDERELG